MSDEPGLRLGRTTRTGSYLPGYWMYETSGVLRPAVLAYLNRAPMTGQQIAAMRAYLRQWMAAPWRTPLLDVLRTMVGEIVTEQELRRWFALALAENIDPL